MTNDTSLLDRFNATIPSQISATSPTSSTKHSVKPAVIGVSVAVPVVFIALSAALIFWFLKRKRTRKQDGNELDTSGGLTREELNGNPGAKELHGSNAGKEMDASEQRYQLDAKEKPGELDGGQNELPPVEME